MLSLKRVLKLSTVVLLLGILIYVLGFYMGSSYYTSDGIKKGQRLWHSIYKPMIFWDIDQDLYSFSQADSKFWITARLNSITEEGHKSGDMTCDFTRSDGKKFTTFIIYLPVDVSESPESYQKLFSSITKDFL